jgi:hypothetical protein
MTRIWCSISSHGFGHAAQMVPVLNALGRRVPGLTAILRTQVPARFFEGRLGIPWELSAAQQDVGCVQRGPLAIDVEATWAACLRFHGDWERKVEAEAQAIRSHAPALVLSDISCLALEAGAVAKTPAVGLCNLTWDGVLAMLLESDSRERLHLIERMRQSYRLAELMLRIAPGIPMGAFRKIADVGPVAELVASEAGMLREAVGAGADERVALVAFGGIALDGLPCDRLDRMHGWRFVVSGPVPAGAGRICSAESIPLSFSALLASADVIVTKPGYATTVEAVAYRKPVVYVRRYNFADEAGLVEYLHRYGCGVELSAEDFAAGRWESALAEASSGKPTMEAPAPTGAAEAAEILAQYLR